MSTTKRKVAVLSGAVATLGLLTMTASSASANEHNLKQTKPTAVETKNESVTQKSMNRPTVRQQPTQKPTMQPSNEGGCSCCKNMMGGNMSGMMNHNKDMRQPMPGMMEMPKSSQ